MIHEIHASSFSDPVPDFREHTEISQLSLVPRSRCQIARSRFSTPGSIYKCTDKHIFVEDVLLGKRRLSSVEQCNAPSTIKLCNLICARIVEQMAEASPISTPKFIAYTSSIVGADKRIVTMILAQITLRDK